MAAPIVRTISRYLLRQHIAPLGFALAALTSLMLIQQVAKQLSSLLGKGLPTAVIVEVFVLSLPFIVAVTLPMAVLVAVLHVFTRLAGDNEITAMQAGGLSVMRLVTPVFAGAAGVALLSFLWNDQLLPRSNHALRTLQVDIQRKKPSLTLKEQVINEVVPGQTFLRAARIDGNTSKLKDVTLFDLGNAERRRIITADSGRMAYASGGRDLFLTLEDGDIQEVSRTDPTQFNRTFFRTNRLRVVGVGNSFVQTENDTYKSDREMSTCEMRAAARDARQDGERAARDAQLVIVNDLRRLVGLAVAPQLGVPYQPDTEPPGVYCHLMRRLTTWLLPASAQAQTPQSRPAAPVRPATRPRPLPLPPPPGRLAPPPVQTPTVWVTPGAGQAEEQRLRNAATRAATYEVEIHKKYAIAAACLIFALVGAPVALRFQRGGVGLVIGMSVAVFTVYYVGLIGGEELGDRLIVSPFFAMWTPNLIFAVVGLVALWRIRKPGNSPHGGDWSDLREAFTRPLAWLRR
ncbi:MAG TPA: LptF/LptG family permease [Gemmatimonadales bacterium]|nr:LptF/LptG family permease [Gemmatimonadales bacterium]